MLQSMTGFAREETTTDWGKVVWELRSINHRYSDINIRMPGAFSRMEIELRQLIGNTFKRGKIEATLSIIKPATKIYSVNYPVLDKINNLAKELSQRYQLAPLTVSQLMNWPDALYVEEDISTEISTTITHTLENTLTKLKKMRLAEGEVLKKYLDERIHILLERLHNLQNKLPEIYQIYRQQLQTKLADLPLQVDPNRLEQEMLLILQKSDVAEELSRLNSHATQMINALQQGEVVGRKLDFLLQELNREANTLGAKAITVEITEHVIEFKVLIEQMREQVQNVA